VLAALQTLLVLLGLTFLLGQSMRWLSRLAPPRRQLAVGGGFGLVAIGAMATSVDLGSGVIADLRNVAVAGAALFGGPVASLVAALIAAAFRAAIGTQLFGALLGIGAAALLGIGFHMLLPARGKPVEARQVVLLGIVLAMVNAAIPFPPALLGFLPWDRAVEIGRTIFFGAIVLYPLGMLILWGFLRLELARLAGEQALAEANRALASSDAALQASQARFQAVMQHTPFCVAVKNLDGRFTYVNPAWERQFGVPAEKLIGQTAAAMASPEHAAMYAAQDREVVATGRPLQLEVTAPGPEGPRTTLSVKFPMLDAGGRPGAIGIIVADVTEQRRTDAQLAHAQRLQTVGQLTGGVAHDFNNLLMVVLGNAEQLMTDAAIGSQQRQVARAIVGAAERGAELVRRLLAFSRRQALRPEAVDVNRLIEGMEPLIRRTLGAHIEIAAVPAAALWPALADPMQIESAILNLVVNARDAMPDGGRVSIETANVSFTGAAGGADELRAGDYVLIAVSDTGCGMTPEVAARAVEPFFTTKEVGQGSGLGLSMVYGFAKQSGGDVRLYTEPGHGTAVKLYLPRADANAAEPAGMAGVRREATGQETILVVEDDPQVRATVVGQLRALGYRVLGREDGASALAALGGEDAVDLLFTDLVMPGGLNGRQLAEEARRLRPSLRVLFTSGYTEDAAIRHGRVDTGAQVLNKPYRRHELSRAIREALDATG